MNGDGVASTDEAANLLSNFIVCVEMLVMAQVFALAFPPSDYADPCLADGTRKKSGSRYLLQPTSLGAALLGPVSLDGSINLSTSAHGPSAARPAAFTIHAPWRDDDDDDLLSSWRGPNGASSSAPTPTLHGLALSGMASDLARSFDFWDVLRDMRTMASIGKVPGDLGFEAPPRSAREHPEPEPEATSPEGPTVLDPTVLERLLGRRWVPTLRPQAAVAYLPPSSRGEASRGDGGGARRASPLGCRDGGAAPQAASPRGRAAPARPMFGRAESDEWGEESVDLEV